MGTLARIRQANDIAYFGGHTMNHLYKYFRPLVSDEEGQTLIEYALIILLVVLVAIATLSPVGQKVASAWTTIADQL